MSDLSLAPPGSRPPTGPDDTAAVTEDRLLGGRLRLRQPAAGYRVAVDPVLLAAAVPAQAGDRVADLGCGVGTVGLCLLARVPEARVVGLELQAPLVALAGENARINGVADRFSVFQGDVLALPPALAPGSFDQVCCNPPYLAAGSATAPDDAIESAAVSERDARLSDWIAAAIALLRPKGALTLIHRADRLDAVLAGLHRRAGEIVVYPVWPRSPTGADAKGAKRVLVQARKGIRTPTRLAPGLVLHQADGSFTADADAVLRDGQALDL